MQKAISQEPVVTFLIDEKGLLTLTGDFDLTRVGVTEQLSPGKSVFDLYRDNPALIEAIHKAFRGEHVTLETSFKGSIFGNSYSPLFDANGKVQRVIGVSYDITESRKAEESMRKSEFLLRTLFNSASDAMFTMDNRTFIDCNEATLRIFQCTREQIVGQTPYRYSPQTQPDGRPSEAAAMEKINAALSGNPQFFEWRHIRYDGTPFDAEVSLNRFDVEDEVFIQAMVRDVSERKRAEEENRRLAMVANTTTNMVVLADGEGRIEWVNPAFMRITGYALEELIGKKPGHVLRGPDTDREASTFMSEAIKKGSGFKDVEIVNYTKAGKPYWVSIEVQPIHDRTGKAIQFIAIESDITERKATEQTLVDRNQELIKINAELDRFVYSASHDLRAPIASLLGLIEVARLEKNPETISQLLDMQKKSLLRMDRFINDIVDHSRNTRLNVESESIHFKSVIHSTFEQLQFMDNVSRIRKAITVHQQGEFYTSRSRMDIILNNLLSNAIKYADVRKDDPFLEIDVTTDSNHAIIHIRDNGEGIPMEAQSRIFDMFYRASGRGTGSGLGLYIVKEAVTKLGGSIQVISEYGKGTEFIVDIPNFHRPVDSKHK
jgi:PAS domain S-box-containing protein